MRFSLILLSVCLSLSAIAQRIGNSPYPPITATPDTLYHVHIDGMTNSQQLTVVTLQGLLAKTKPQIMIDRGTIAFQRDLSLHYGVTYDSTYFHDFSGLIAHFASHISGYILCGLNDSTTNAAISLCSNRDAIAVTVADTAVMSANGLPMLLSAIGKNQSWAYDSLGVTYSDRIVGFQDWGKCTYLSDYSVFANAFHFTSAMNSPLTLRAFNHMQPNGALLGWGSENDLVLTASQHGLHVHAADFANNLSTYTNFQVPNHQHVASSDTDIIAGKHTVCFIMTDGDNVQWLLGDFASNALWYGSPNRGIANIGWTVSPALAELAPTVLQYLYDSARSGPGQDYFIAGPSGMGYSYPDDFMPLDSSAAITDRMMQKADLSIVNVICNLYLPQSFVPYMAQPHIDAMFFYSFSDGYTGLNGFSTCINNKPFISARYTLWQSYCSAPILARLVEGLPKDPTLAESYTLVSVHVWDHSVDSVIESIREFDSTIRVVSPDAFIKLFKKGTGCRLFGLGTNDLSANNSVKLTSAPNPSKTQSELSYHLDNNSFITIKLYDDSGREVKAIYAGSQSAGDHQAVVDMHDLSAGSYIFSLSGNGINAVSRCQVVK